MSENTENTENIKNTGAEEQTDVAVEEQAAPEVTTEEVVEEATTEEVAPEAVEETEEAVTETAEAGSTIPDFKAGDTLRLGVRITEGDKVRIQYFEGIVLARKGAGVNKTFTIRKIGAGGVAVERIFPLYSPSLASFEVRRRGVTRRAKIYFLRDIVGSTANVIKERKVVRDRTEAKAAKSAKKAAKVAKRSEQATTRPTDKKAGTRSSRRADKKSS